MQHSQLSGMLTSILVRWEPEWLMASSRTLTCPTRSVRVFVINIIVRTEMFSHQLSSCWFSSASYWLKQPMSGTPRILMAPRSIRPSRHLHLIYTFTLQHMYNASPMWPLLPTPPFIAELTLASENTIFPCCLCGELCPVVATPSYHT